MTPKRWRQIRKWCSHMTSTAWVGGDQGESFRELMAYVEELRAAVKWYREHRIALTVRATQLQRVRGQHDALRRRCDTLKAERDALQEELNRAQGAPTA